MTLSVAAAAAILGFGAGSGHRRTSPSASAVAAQASTPSPLRELRAQDQASIAAAPGRSLDEPPNLITPLNVRDAAALVMAPGSINESISKPEPGIAGKPVPQPKHRNKKAKGELWRSPQDYHF